MRPALLVAFCWAARRVLLGCCLWVAESYLISIERIQTNAIETVSMRVLASKVSVAIF